MAASAFPVLPALAVIGAGVLHATWNAMAKAIKDRYAGFALMGAAAAACGVVLLLVSPVPARAAWPWLCASAVLHGVYTALLARCYRHGDFNQVYPLARGTAPLLVALVAATTLGERLSLAQLAGIAAVCGGLGALALAGGNLRAHRAAVAAALLTGVSIAGYTLLDGIGVRHSGSAPGYGGWLFLQEGTLVFGWAVAVRGRALLPGLAAHWRPGLAGGVVSVVAYGVVLWAQTRGALAAVAALRETGVITGALIGVVAFKEPMGRPRIVAATVVAAGVALINLR
jgi:drug/metabolite transporter (DMT)-like permease